MTIRLAYGLVLLGIGVFIGRFSVTPHLSHTFTTALTRSSDIQAVSQEPSEKQQTHGGLAARSPASCHPVTAIPDDPVEALQNYSIAAINHACAYTQSHFSTDRLNEFGGTWLIDSYDKKNNSEHHTYFKEMGRKIASNRVLRMKGSGTIMIKDKITTIEMVLEAWGFFESRDEKPKKDPCFTLHWVARVPGEDMAHGLDEICFHDLKIKDGTYYFTKLAYDDYKFQDHFAMVSIPLPFGNASRISIVSNETYAWQHSDNFKWTPVPLLEALDLENSWINEYNEVVARQEAAAGRPPPLKAIMSREEEE